MEIILTQDVQGLGYKNDIVKVKAGYGRNFLIPNGSAMIANESNKRMTIENVRQASHKAAKLKQDAEALGAKIGELTVEIGTKAGETGKIFGAVTAIQIADELKRQYVIGFYPTNAEGGKSANITIKVNRDGAVVRSKKTIRLKPRTPDGKKKDK